MSETAIVKQFVPCLYIYHGSAVKSMIDHTIIEMDPLRLLTSFCEKCADEAIVFFLPEETDANSVTDRLGILNEMLNISQIPLMVSFPDFDLEEIAKALSLPIKRLIIYLQDAKSRSRLDHLATEYGRRRLVGMFDDPSILLQHHRLITNSCSRLLLMDPHMIADTQNNIHMPFYVNVERSSLNKLLEVFENEFVCGITGNTINDNHKEILALKTLCQQQGIKIQTLDAAFPWSAFKLNNDGMVPVVVQDDENDEVLMVAYMNKESYEATIRSGKMTYYSRSRNELWLKGDTSGHFQYVKSLSADCDMDTILARVIQIGAACHTGSRNCFFNTIVEKANNKSNTCANKNESSTDYTYQNPDRLDQYFAFIKADLEASDKIIENTSCDLDQAATERTEAESELAGNVSEFFAEEEKIAKLNGILSCLNADVADIILAAKDKEKDAEKQAIAQTIHNLMMLMATEDLSVEDVWNAMNS